ncbi:MAG: T9SS type A sorting domain-containing protein [Crocinitomicaceae bacterium]|nr:MAG: T9SS type A sorting domain-containing protein [Crocinitomicaceae bacterium]
MKKVMSSIGLILFVGGFAMATEKNVSDKDKKDSSNGSEVAAAETTFATNYANQTHTLTVNVTNVLDPYASISVTNQRGATIQCAFIQNTTGEFVFDLSQLDKGIYNVMLITDKEIRIKRLTIN